MVVGAPMTDEPDNVIVTPGRTAFVVSVTVPLMEPAVILAVWPCTTLDTRTSANVAAIIFVPVTVTLLSVVSASGVHRSKKLSVRVELTILALKRTFGNLARRQTPTAPCGSRIANLAAESRARQRLWQSSAF